MSCRIVSRPNGDAVLYRRAHDRQTAVIELPPLRITAAELERHCSHVTSVRFRRSSASRMALPKPVGRLGRAKAACL